MIDDSGLLHKQPYDPQKAREYYLRTRHLKGRHKGTGDQPVGRDHQAQPKTAAQRRKEAEVQVAALKKRLEHLKKVLAELVKKAKERAGIEAPTPKSLANKNADTKARTPLTAKQKRDAAKRAKENYDKKHQSPDKELADLQTQIKSIKAKIKAAIEDAKKQSSHSSKSKTALKGR